MMDIDKIIYIPHKIFRNPTILKTIFLNIANANIRYYNVNQDLLSLLYVCKTWYRVAAPILYSKIIYNGGITRGVYKGTYTKLETIAKFITNNKKQSEEYHLYDFLNNNEAEMDVDIGNNFSKDEKSTPSHSLYFSLNLEFTKFEQDILDAFDIRLLPAIKKCINNINSLRSSAVPLTKDKIEEVQNANDELIKFFTDLEPKYHSSLKTFLIEHPYDSLFRRLREGITQLKNINLFSVLSNGTDSNSYSTNTLFVPDLYTNVKMIFFNKTDQFRNVDQLYAYKSAYLDWIGSCRNLEVLSIGSKEDKRHLLMEKDLKELFYHHAFSRLRYLALNNLQYITGETSFKHIPSTIEALRLDFCKNITVDSIIQVIKRVGARLKLLSLKDGTISEELLKTILKYCTNLIFVDISYSKAEKDYVRKDFQNHVQDIIELNKDLRIFNVYGILDLKNIQKTEQLYPQVKLYNNENMRQHNFYITSGYNDYSEWHRYLKQDLNISMEYQYELS